MDSSYIEGKIIQKMTWRERKIGSSYREVRVFEGLKYRESTVLSSRVVKMTKREFRQSEDA